MEISAVEMADGNFRSAGTFDYDLNLERYAKYIHPIAYSICVRR